MRKGSLLSRIRGYVYNSEIDIKDRSFVIFSYAILLALFLSVLSGMIMGEPISSTIATSIGLLLFTLYVSLSLKFNKLKSARMIISIVVVLIFLPAMFFTNGGIDGGTPIWIILGTLYIVLIQEGKARAFFLITDGVLMLGCYIVSFYYPDLVTTFSRNDEYVDSILGLFIVGFICFMMLAFQDKLYQAQNKLAEEKTKELEEMNRSQNRFFSSMSHEIRTPINTVLGLNEIILRQDDASEEIKKDAVNIRGAGKMLLALINDILDVSKIEAGKMDIVPVEYNVGALISEIVNMIWLKAEEKGLEFHVDVDPSVPEELFGDEVRIKQILINLLNNAVKYTKEGSISFHVECESVDEDTTMICISISDTGMGIRQEALPHLFDTFQRVDEEKNRHIEGTGLGLSIVKQLVDLMDGEITVNSVYSQGSTFTVRVKQRVASAKQIGNLEISNMGAGQTTKFEHKFHAPEASILIVDDNEMNLQVEKKLLEGTEMNIDLALSGEKALEMTLENRYDVVFMDHLMPEMDGIECFRRIREQKGGLNRQVPIIVLTANAGGENIELYNNTGFDGYLVKPVSGEQLENMLLTHLPEEKVSYHGSQEMVAGQMNTSKGYARKRAVAITTSSMADLPKSVLRDQRIDTIPFYVMTEEGRYADGVEIDSDEMARFMLDESRMVLSEPSSVEEYISFFSEQLKKAHHLIHIVITPNSSVEYERAMEAAKSFDNVSLVDSGCFSSVTGMLVLIANRMAQKNEPVSHIIQELEIAKKQLRCSFIVSNTDYMTRRGFIPPAINKVFRALWAHPVLRFKNEKLGIGKMLFGNVDKIFNKYINKTLSRKANPDPDIAFITYTGLEEEQLVHIEELVRKRFCFKHIVIQKASAGITSNCGPGTFGVLFLEKGEKSYYLASLFESEEREDRAPSVKEETEEAKEEVSHQQDKQKVTEISVPKEWYEEIPGIDADYAIKNSGSKDTFLTVMKLYHESGQERDDEITGFFENEDWENYTIKVHALKSGSRLIGAMELGDKAEKLEAAGKSEDVDFIKENHPIMMDEFRTIRKLLAEQYDEPDEPDEPEEKDDRPVADAFLMEGVYEMLREGAEAGDSSQIEDSFAEIEEYRVPDEEKDLMDRLKTAYESGDFSLIIKELDEAGKA